MFSKSVFVITIALCSAQVLAENSPSKQAQTKLKLLKENVSTGINTAVTAYNSISQEIDATSLINKINGTTVIQAYAEEYIQQFDIIKNASAQEGVDITDCLDRVENYIKNLGPESESNFNQCVDMVLESALGTIQSNIMEGVSKIFNIVVEDEKRVVQCGDIDDVCLDGIISKIDVDADNVRKESAKLIQSYVQVYQMYPSTIGDLCINRYIPTTIGKGQSLIDNLQECVTIVTSTR